MTPIATIAPVALIACGENTNKIATKNVVDKLSENFFMILA
ncbi:hypothetical protein ACW95P_01235 [Candidatus Mycoplasma pogonae]